MILTLRLWKRDDALVDVDPAANEDIPGNDRAAWKALWADVDATRTRAEEAVARAQREAVRVNAARVEMRTKRD